MFQKWIPQIKKALFTFDLKLNSCHTLGDISTNGCSMQLLKGLEGTLESPGFPNHYSNNLNCKWTILVPEKYTAIRLEIIKFSVENPRWSRMCLRDYVDIFHFPNDKKERKVRICGRKHGKLLLVNGKKLEFHFKTNFLRTRRGFQIKWKAVEGITFSHFPRNKNVGGLCFNYYFSTYFPEYWFAIDFVFRKRHRVVCIFNCFDKDNLWLLFSIFFIYLFADCLYHLLSAQ